jgi:hypothetical protein
MPSLPVPLAQWRLSSYFSVAPRPAQACTKRPQIQRLQVCFGGPKGATGPSFFLETPSPSFL